jgi:feruloyl esterase
MEAQRYPDDFDGIVAGNPANDWTRFYAGAHLWYAQATLRDSGSYMPPAKLPALAAAVNAACDALDGIEDGVLDDPRQCRFDPAVLTCPYGEDHDGCLTPPQVQAVKDIRAGSRDSAGETIFPGLVPGGENGPGGGWGSWVTGREPFTSLHWLAAEGFFKYMVFEDPDWNFRTFDFDADLAFALDKVGAALDSASPDLGTFRDGGSKLIVYHGWSDPDISPLGSINYYENVLATAGGADAADGGARDRAISETQAFFRLFLVPGMGHCSGGPGYNRVDPLPALERWVEDGIAPDTILGTRVEGGEVVRSRPVCAYPGASTWDGAGDPDDAASFRCDASTYASRR